jgi:Flp pilus assembly pilin Flp
MLNFIKTFAADEDGAVTVDWVVLTAAVVGLGLAVMTVVKPGVNSVSQKINTKLSTTTISNSF